MNSTLKTLAMSFAIFASFLVGSILIGMLLHGGDPSEAQVLKIWAYAATVAVIFLAEEKLP